MCIYLYVYFRYYGMYYGINMFGASIRSSWYHGDTPGLRAALLRPQLPQRQRRAAAVPGATTPGAGQGPPGIQGFLPWPQ